MEFRRLKIFVPPDVPKGDWQRTIVAQILERANVILGNRDFEEVQYMLDSLGYLLTEGVPLYQANNSGQLGITLNPSTILRELMEQVDISSQDDLLSATWSEYFASLAIGLIEHAVVYEEERLLPGRQIVTLDSIRMSFDVRLVAAATEAVVSAEFVAMRVKLHNGQTDVRKMLSMNAQKAAIARWSTSVAIKDRFALEFRSGKLGSQSVRECAAQYYRSLSDTESRILCPTRIPTNAVRTLVAYIKAQITPG